MIGLKNLLIKEQERLRNISNIAANRLKNAPNGSLRISRNGNHIQYYLCTDIDKRGKYISKKKEELIQVLVQKSYDEKIVRLTEKRLQQIEKILKDYGDDEIEQIFLQEHLGRRKFIHTVEPTWEEMLKKWKSEEYQGKEFREGTPIIVTERGERVRSKSEKIMADYFYRNGIEYKYECPIHLKGMGIVYPDFTFLSKKTGEEIYWEHNGMVDSPAYARRMVQKIEAYENNGIFPGERLILTYETEQSILNTRKIEQMVEKYLK